MNVRTPGEASKRNRKPVIAEAEKSVGRSGSLMRDSSPKGMSTRKPGMAFGGIMESVWRVEYM
jgi:hypothetical protein